MEFGSHADRIVTIAAALVNDLTPGLREGRPWEAPEGPELVARARTAVDARDGSKKDWTLEQAQELRAVAAALREVFELAEADDTDDAAEAINRLLVRYDAHPLLVRHDGKSWHLHFHSAGASRASGWAAGCAAGLAMVLDAGGLERLGICSADRCDRVFVDVSRNASKRFCSTACQNRAKAAAFRARHNARTRRPAPGAARP